MRKQAGRLGGQRLDGQLGSIPSRRGSIRGQLGFNLVELLMSMSMATILFMAMVVLFVRQGEVMQQQNEQIDVSREARFVLDHLRRDLTALGSNSTPHSEIDPLVCPKPATVLRAISLEAATGYVQDVNLNPNVAPMALTLFGGLDVKQRFRTASVDGDTVFLEDDGKLPTTQPAFEAIFSNDRYLRLAGPDGQMMFFPIASADLGNRSVTVVGIIPRKGGGQVCGYQSFGTGLWVDVQGFVRYRVVADSRAGAPKDPNGGAERGLLVRERMGIDGKTAGPQLILAENAVDIAIYDAAFDDDPQPDAVKLKVNPLPSDLVQKNGDGVLGSTMSSQPQTLRALTVKVSLRAADADRSLTHTPRAVAYSPIETWLVASDGRGAHRVFTVASRVALPTMVSRNL